MRFYPIVSTTVNFVAGNFILKVFIDGIFFPYKFLIVKNVPRTLKSLSKFTSNQTAAKLPHKRLVKETTQVPREVLEHIAIDLDIPSFCYLL